MLTAATWNVRSLVDVEGSILTASRAHAGSAGSAGSGNMSARREERKIDLVLRQLQRLHLETVGLQETLWFGNEAYTVGDSIVLTAGRPVPDEGSPCRRGEGVALVLRGLCRAAFTDGGCVWTAHSPRLLSANLKFVCGRSRQPYHVRVAVAYAPTFARPRSEKSEFSDQLQTFLASVPPDDHFIVLGDFNARVGSSDSSCEDPWRAVLGPFGFGARNSAGEELLSLLSLHGATICNTWFAKGKRLRHTWQHPRSKRNYCIDYCIVAQRRRQLCTDCQVVPSAECDTDHRLLCMRYRLSGKPRHRLQTSRSARPIAVNKLLETVTIRRGDRTACTRQPSSLARRFGERLGEALSEKWQSARPTSVERKWEVLRSVTMEAATDIIGTERRRQPEWFADSQNIVEPMLRQRDTLYQRWTASHRQRDKAAYRKQRSATRLAIRRAKENWLRNQAEEMERWRVGGCGLGVWKSIANIQRAKLGLQAVRADTIKDRHGRPCDSADSANKRWREHFQTVLNIRSRFDRPTILSVAQRPIREAMATPPTADEIMRAISRTKNRKATGSSGISAELLKSAGPVFIDRLVELLASVWRDGQVPRDWVDAVLVPIPKKGDLSNCDNWRGISLLDVAGKVAARLIADRLQELAEDVLPDSQCGFRRGRGCTDMIFAVRQAVEKTYEHRCKAYISFIDLRKAYDSVPRAALWMVLERLGVPPSLITIIRSFHTDMAATIRVNATTLEPFAVQNGLRQGCTMAPVLFNLYMAAVMEVWHARVADDPDIGLRVQQFRQPQLFNARLKPCGLLLLTECQFADDAALLAATRPGSERSLTSFAEVCTAFGLLVNATKTKAMPVGFGTTDTDRAPIVTPVGPVNAVDRFRYLGSLVTPDGRSSADIRARIASAGTAFARLRPAVFDNRNISITTKRLVYNVAVLAVLLYGSECWTVRQQDLRALETFHLRCLRSMLRVTRSRQIAEHITSLIVRQRWGDRLMVADHIALRRLRWLGHVYRMADRIPRQMMFGSLSPKRPRCKPLKRWKDVIHADLATIGATNKWTKTAVDREQWRTLCHDGIARLSENRERAKPCEIVCSGCGRRFRRPQDHQRHKCTAERAKPLNEQRGSAQCAQCGRWLRSRGGLARHKCVPLSTNVTPVLASGTTAAFICDTCGRAFTTKSGRTRHHCVRTTSTTSFPCYTVMASGTTAVFICDTCGRAFTTKSGRTRHHCVRAPSTTTFPCDTCQRTFITKSGRSRHKCTR